ncbi:MAG: sugar ABC transporter substrate-binding protein [Anaerolineaceae bacterium]|nr:sugar ABC transporter substrate-binding protein [Anaerolineaceae bacterium]
MNKRFLLVLALLALLLPAVLVVAQDEVVTVTWWATERGRDTAATRDMHFTLARTFEESHPNIRVALALYPSRGFATRVLTAIAADEGPDVFYHYFAPDIANQGFLEDLTPYIEASGSSTNWFPNGVARGIYEGHTYAVPRDAAAGFVAYNKDLFDAAGVAYPEDGWTIADFRALANQLTNRDNDIYGVGAIVGGEGCMLWSPFSFNLGGEITSPDGRDVVGYMDSPETVAAMTWCLELVTEDQVTAPAELQDQFGELVFLSGNVAMQSISDWELAAITEQADFNWAVVAPPRYDENTDVVPWTDSYMYYMWNGSRHKDAAWELMNWLSGPEAQRIAAEAGVWTPNGPAVYQELGWDTDPIRSVSYNQLINSERVPNYLRSQYFWDCVYGPLADTRVRWIEGGERDVAGMLAEGAVQAQACLDDNYGG